MVPPARAQAHRSPLGIWKRWSSQPALALGPHRFLKDDSPRHGWGWGTDLSILILHPTVSTQISHVPPSMIESETIQGPRGQLHEQQNPSRGSTDSWLQIRRPCIAGCLGYFQLTVLSFLLWKQYMLIAESRKLRKAKEEIKNKCNPGLPRWLLLTLPWLFFCPLFSFTQNWGQAQWFSKLLNIIGRHGF